MNNTRVFHVTYKKIVSLLDNMNSTRKDREKTLYKFMDYLCDHIEELIEFFDYRLIRIINIIRDKVEEVDDSERAKFDEYFDKLERFIEKYPENEYYEEYEEQDDMSYWGYEEKKPPHYKEMDDLQRYVNFILLKVWPMEDDLDVKNIKSMDELMKFKRIINI